MLERKEPNSHEVSGLLLVYHKTPDFVSLLVPTDAEAKRVMLYAIEIMK